MFSTSTRAEHSEPFFRTFSFCIACAESTKRRSPADARLHFSRSLCNNARAAPLPQAVSFASPCEKGKKEEEKKKRVCDLSDLGVLRSVSGRRTRIELAGRHPKAWFSHPRPPSAPTSLPLLPAYQIVDDGSKRKREDEQTRKSVPGRAPRGVMWPRMTRHVTDKPGCLCRSPRRPSRLGLAYVAYFAYFDLGSLLKLSSARTHCLSHLAARFGESDLSAAVTSCVTFSTVLIAPPRGSSSTFPAAWARFGRVVVGT